MASMANLETFLVRETGEICFYIMYMIHIFVYKYIFKSSFTRNLLMIYVLISRFMLYPG